MEGCTEGFMDSAWTAVQSGEKSCVQRAVQNSVQMGV